MSRKFCTAAQTPAQREYSDLFRRLEALQTEVEMLRSGLLQLANKPAAVTQSELRGSVEGISKGVAQIIHPVEARIATLEQALAQSQADVIHLQGRLGVERAQPTRAMAPLTNRHGAAH